MTRGQSQEGKREHEREGRREHEPTDLSARMQQRKWCNYGVPGGGTVPGVRRRDDGGNIFNVDSAVERRVPEHDQHVISSRSYLLSSPYFIYV
jgi:hypothetical protein